MFLKIKKENTGKYLWIKNEHKKTIYTEGSP
jgi:hypothetical protein